MFNGCRSKCQTSELSDYHLFVSHDSATYLYYSSSIGTMKTLNRYVTHLQQGDQYLIQNDEKVIL